MNPAADANSSPSVPRTPPWDLMPRLRRTIAILNIIVAIAGLFGQGMLIVLWGMMLDSSHRSYIPLWAHLLIAMALAYTFLGWRLLIGYWNYHKKQTRGHRQIARFWWWSVAYNAVLLVPFSGAAFSMASRMRYGMSVSSMMIVFPFLYVIGMIAASVTMALAHRGAHKQEQEARAVAQMIAEDQAEVAQGLRQDQPAGPA